MQCLLPDNRCHVDFIQICIKCISTSDKRGPDSALRSRQQKGNVRAPNKITGSKWSGHRTLKSLAPHLTCTKGFGKILHFITSCSFPAPRFHENHQRERSKARWSQRNWKSWTALRAVSADPKMNAQLWLQKGARLQGVQLHESANTWNFDHRDTLNLFVAAWSHTHKILFFFSASSDTACSAGRSWLPGRQLKEAFGALLLSPSVGEVFSAAPEMPGACLSKDSVGKVMEFIKV